MTAEGIFQFTNTAVLPFWGLLAFAPRWVWTRRLVQSGLVSGVLAVFYIACLASTHSKIDFGSFGSIPGIRELFADDWALVGGWVHYLAFDLFVGGVITREHCERGGGRAGLVVKLVLTLMAGPVGLLVHKLLHGGVEFEK